jgi:RHS repeat-associated protein
VKKVVNTAETHYVWQGSQVLSEHNGSTGAALASYFYGGSRMIAKLEASTMRYYLSDRLSTRLVLDNSGNVIGKQSHLPFGEEIAASGTQQKHHLTSYERDVESGQDYAINRMYSLVAGRFSQLDPKAASARPAAPQTWNRYSYTNNDPVNQVDPLGLDPEPGYEHMCPAWIRDCSTYFGTPGFSGRISFGPLLGGGDGGGRTPIDIGPPPSVRKCSITVRTRSDERLRGRYGVDDMFGAVDGRNLGAIQHTASDGFWGFTFELQVSLPGDATDLSQWHYPHQSIIRQGYVTVIVGGQEVKVDKSLGKDPDGPRAEFTDDSQRGVYYWTDTPSIEKTAFVNSVRHQVVNGVIVFNFTFNFNHRQDKRRSCSAKLWLTLTINEGRASWSE